MLRRERESSKMDVTIWKEEEENLSANKREKKKLHYQENNIISYHIMYII